MLQRTLGRIRGRRQSTDFPYPQPVEIFGTGGSGTRLLQVLTDRSGYYLGANLNSAGDALDIGHFMRRWLDRYLDDTDWIRATIEGTDRSRFGYPRAMAEDFAATLDDHRETIEDPDAPWGWKAPRTILMLPFTYEQFPGVRAIHLVRDGRDMAYSRNQQQAQRHARQLLDGGHDELTEPERSIAFWARVNLAAARYGERNLGDNYKCLRYEDVCRDPAAAATQLLDFLDSPAPRESIREVAVESIRPSSSIGHWREHDRAEIEALESIAGDALRHFGYE